MAVVGAVAVLLSGCGGGRHRSSPRTTPAPAPPPPARPVPELSYGLAAVPPGNWNVLAAGADTPALTQVVDQVWPSVFHTGPNFSPRLDTTFVTSATETSSVPQTIVYRINPKAVWSDGTPITGADFAYTWQAQSGQAGFSDVGGKPYTPASTAGYSQISAVRFTASSPDVVTVVFSAPYADWHSLFSHIIPAHVAERVGFDAGFTDPVADLVSGGPYEVVSYDPTGTVRLVRNPGYWGPPAAAPALDFVFVPDPAQIGAALRAGQLSCAGVQADASTLSPLRKSAALAVRVAPGDEYLDLDFRESGGPLAADTLRAAVSAAINRAGLVSHVVGAVDPGAAPVANRFLVPGQPGYHAGGPVPPPVSAGAGAHTATPLRLVSGQDPLAVAASRVVVADLAVAGIAVTATAVASLPAVLTSEDWDMAVEVRPRTPFPGLSLDVYRSGSATNVDGFASPAMDALLQSAAAASGTARATLIDEADQLAWTDHVDLPLVALPTAVVCQSGVTGVAPNPAPEGPAYDANSWGAGM
ncbi:MAG: ABC transporter substrate-binding protein [Acidimicrobiales bacterium]